MNQITNTEIDTNLVIRIDGSLNNEYMAAINAERRREQIQLVGSTIVNVMKQSVVKTGRGALYAYAKFYDDMNSTNTRQEIFG